MRKKTNINRRNRCVACICAIVLALGQTVSVCAEESVSAQSVEESDVWDGLNPDDTVLVVGDEKVPLRKAYFLLKFQQSIVQSMQKGMYGDNWYSLPLYEGDRSFQDNMKDSIRNLLVRMSLARQHMDEYGVSISKDEQSRIDEAVDKFFAANSDEAAHVMMADRETVEEILTDYTILAKVIAAVTKDAKAEYGKAKTYSYIYGTITKSESVLERDESSESMIEAFGAIRDSVNAGEDFDTAAAEKGYPSAMHTYFIEDDSDKLAELNEVMDELDEGQVSDIVYTKSGSGVFVGYREELDEDSLEEAKASLLLNEKKKLLRKEVQGWMKKTKSTKSDELWEQMTLRRPLAAYTSIQAE